MLQQVNGVVDMMARDPSLVSLWRRGHQGLADLSDDERLQLSSVFLTFMRPYEELFYYRRDQAIDEWAWESVLALVRQPMGTPGFAEWWAVRRDWFSADFREYVDGSFSGLPSNPDLGRQYLDDGTFG